MNKIYFAGSLYGVGHENPNFIWDLAQYAKELGFEILDEDVVAPTAELRNKIFLEKTGIDTFKIEEPWNPVYRADMDAINEANYFIGIVDGPSHGVGMELMRVLLKPKLGLNQTKILCLLHEKSLPRLSRMIRGVPKDKYPNFEIKTYKDLSSAKEITKEFLTKRG